MKKYVILLSVVAVLFLEGAASLDQSKPGIYWRILHPPISYGTDVQLVCNITCCIQHANESASWVIGDSKSLSQNLILANDAKYNILTSKHACRLEIKDFGPDDANKVYSCYYNFQRYSDNLTLDARSFESQPNKDAIAVRGRNSNGRYTIHAEIQNVFPKPECEAYIDQTNLTSSLVILPEKQRILFNISIELSFDIVDGIFRLICRIGTRLYMLKETTFITTCTEKISIFQIVMVIVFVDVIVLVVLSVVMYLCLRHSKGNLNKESNVVEATSFQKLLEDNALLDENKTKF